MSMLTKVSLALAVLLTGSAFGEDPVYFADQKLKSCVESVLAVMDPTPTDMLQLTSLTCNHSVNDGVKDMTGLEYGKNLQRLNLGFNQIQRISSLSGLDNLTSLTINDNHLDSLSGLGGLTGLIKLDAHRNQINSVGGLSDMDNLEVLILRGNGLTNISGLSHLPNLWELVLRNNKLSEISALSTLPKLRDLDLRNNRISDLSALSGLNLFYLDVRANDITSVLPLTSLPSLWSLDLRDNYFLDDQTYTQDLQTLLDNNSGLSLTYEPRPFPSVQVAASNGTYPDRVRVTWNDIDNGPQFTSYYQVSRTLQNDPQQELLNAWQTTTTMEDRAALPNKTYQYQVRVAVSATGAEASPLSPPDLGWLAGGARPDATPQTPTESSDLAILYVDDDGTHDPGPYDSTVSDRDEDGSKEHPFDEIQEGIDAADDGDTVLVLPGTYYETIGLMGKNINLTSMESTHTALGVSVLDSGPASPAVAAGSKTNTFPVIDASYEGTVVTFDQGETPNCVLSGFVLTRGYNRSASAIACYGASPVIRNCLIVGNRCEVPPIDDPDGGVLYFVDSDSLVENCTIADNDGAESDAALRVIDCNVIVTNSIIWDSFRNQVLVDSGNDPVIVYSGIQGGWSGVGNIDADPLFVERGIWTDPGRSWLDGDYHLLPESPSIDAGDPDSTPGNEPEPNGGKVNQGAYGGTVHASQSSLGLISHWPFDETSGSMARDIAGGIDGVVQGTDLDLGASWTTGILGGALSFDGIDDHVVCGNSARLSPTDLSISMWVSPLRQNGSMDLVRKTGSGIFSVDYQVSMTVSRRIKFTFADQISSRFTLFSAGDFGESEWTHVCATRDGSEGAIWINGFRDASKPYSFVPAGSSDPLVIGESYRGKIDDLRIYDQGLTEGGVQDIYQGVR